MKKSAMWWEGAEWACSLIGRSSSGEMAGVCENIRSNIDKGERPADYKEGALALVEVALKESRKK